MRRTTWAASVCIGLAACAVSKVDPLTIPLAYKTNTKNAGAFGSLSCAVLSQVQVTDARIDKTLGVRTHESKPLKAEVSAGSDPAAWARDGVAGLLTQNGFTFQNGAPQLVITIDTLRTSESIWHRASYGAQVTMTGWLRSRSGKICWQGTGSGSGGDYGYAGSVEDYQETLNGALDAATVQMVQSSGFKDALCHCAD
jgi:hypothetical protein